MMCAFFTCNSLKMKKICLQFVHHVEFLKASSVSGSAKRVTLGTVVLYIAITSREKGKA